MTREITPEQAIKLASFFKSARANQPHKRPTGRIITDPEEMAKIEPPGILSEYVIKFKRPRTNGDQRQDE